MESLWWSGSAFTVVVWWCIQWGGVIVYSLGWSGGGMMVYSLGWSDCVFTRVEWLCIHLEWSGCVFTGVE